jgi:hypothetical protein
MDSRIDRALMAGTLAAAIALFLLVSANWREFIPAAPVAGSATPVERGRELDTSSVAVTRTGLPRDTASKPTRAASPPPAAVEPARASPARTRAATRPATAPARLDLVVAASRGDCWLEIYAGDSTTPLYYQILGEGQAVRFQRERFSIRVGAGENVDVLVGGRRLASPGGVASFDVTRAGIRPGS